MLFAVFCQLIPLNPTHRTFKCLNLLGFLHWIFLRRKKKKCFFSAGLEDICVSLKNLFFMVENIFLGKLVSFFSLARDEPKKLNLGSWTLIFLFLPFSLPLHLCLFISGSLHLSDCCPSHPPPSETALWLPTTSWLGCIHSAATRCCPCGLGSTCCRSSRVTSASRTVTSVSSCSTELRQFSKTER